MPLPRGYIHVYDNYFQTLFLGNRLANQSEVVKTVYINGTGHMTKIAAMLIYGKIFQKSSPTELIFLRSWKLAWSNM